MVQPQTVVLSEDILTRQVVSQSEGSRTRSVVSIVDLLAKAVTHTLASLPQKEARQNKLVSKDQTT